MEENKIKREKLNTLQEKDLLIGLIISDEFCREICPVLIPKYLEIDYSRIVATWIKKYFDNFGEAPKKEIIKLYRDNCEEITDEALQDNILSFIENINDKYSETSFNAQFAIERSIQYLKYRSVVNFKEDLDASLVNGDTQKAESLITKYRKVEKSSGDKVSIFDDSETILTALTEEKDKLFSLEGPFGSLLGDVNREDFIAFLAPMKAGKCLAKGTEILMYDGSIKEVQDLIIGDKLMGPDSKPRNIEIVSKGFGKMYRITSNINPLKKDKTPEINFICNGAHILVLKNVWNCEKNKIKEFRKDGHKNGELKKNGKNNFLKQDEIEISVEDFLKLSKYQRSHFKLFRTKVEYKSKQHTISPYMLGLWLGDGTSSGPTLTNVDDEIIRYCSKESITIGDNLAVRPDKKFNNKVKQIRFSRDNVRSCNFRKELKRLNLLNNKHIPNEYLIDSEENRLKLLAGIIDTDGYCPGGCCEITLMNKTLIYDIKKLCQQLGFRTSIKENYNYYEGMYPENNGYAYSWTLVITGKLSTIPTILERKKMKDCRKFNSLNNTFSFTMTPLKDDNYYGFVLDGDHRFLLADTTVSHNTFQLTDIGIEAVKRGLKVVFFSLEMSRNSMIKRIWKSFSGQVTEDIDIEVPYFEEQDDGKYKVVKRTVHKKASSVLDIEKKQKQYKKMFRGSSFLLYNEPAYSLTIEKLENKLDDLAFDGFYPDVIIIDYADIMMPSEKGEYRNQLDSIWKRLRATAQARKCAVFTASQTNRSGLNGPVGAETVAEDIRKIAHVTSMVSISKPKECKDMRVAIYEQLATREGSPIVKRAVATQNLAIGRTVMDSKWENEVIMKDFEKKNTLMEEEIKKKNWKN